MTLTSKKPEYKVSILDLHFNVPTNKIYIATGTTLQFQFLALILGMSEAKLTWEVN